MALLNFRTQLNPLHCKVLPASKSRNSSDFQQNLFSKPFNGLRNSFKISFKDGMCVKSHKTQVLLAVSSCASLFYAAVVVVVPTFFFSVFYRTAEFSHIK